MKRVIILFTLLLTLFSINAIGQNKRVKWSKIIIDSTYNPTCCSNLKSSAIIAKYKPEVDKLSSPIGFSPNGLNRGFPVAPLSSWAVDALFSYGRNYLDTTGRKNMKLDFAILNFGGIRTEMPKGNVSKLDVLSIFPFDNHLVIVSMSGKTIKTLMKHFAKTRPQIMSKQVKLEIKNKEVKKCLINGKPIDENKTYNVATIDFLLYGGDGLYALKYNTGVIETKIKMMDIIISHIIDLTSNNKAIEKSIDDRIVIDK